MWAYYGGKTKLVNYYPPPKHDTIIEPFAGTARYALKYFDRKVILMEKFDKVYQIWKYLQDASPADILSLPDIEYKGKVPQSLADAERWLMGYCVARGNAIPVITRQKFCNWETDKKRIADNLHKIKHWDIRQGDYTELENQAATWFIDPPYQVGGYKYKHHDINYDSLAGWCSDRFGQVLVCENMKANWMNFKPLKKFHGARFTTIEALWQKD